MTDLSKPYRGGLVGKTHQFALTVYFEDTDTAQIVYYANYLKFMDRARTDMLQCVGIDHAAVHIEGGGAYAVAEVNIRYLRSAHVGDDLLVLTELREVRAASIRVHQRVMRGAEKLAEAEVTAAFLTPQGRPQRQPRDWMDTFNSLVVQEG
ncbi:YbgC/FadM family acyl-CoA thioesterase [Sphingomonas piscis]|uniref:YbgC/FadM family acyl-CoA thioesterase n=1 Tax=Sphingomonas piscis TaxID=2714943 RepID=A0A6G7YQ82_9SPHN|nr:YbgC/FadM family acyl-CoA thioesterase [Sphingomonas piscis]QIK78900.1 YbgC/FadM family acyl-CoA thioesterase [Sphingomonas piscis]